MFKLRDNGSAGDEFFHILGKPAATINHETE